MIYNLFLDESGDHGLKNIDENFPVFVLCGVILSQLKYDQLKEQFNSIKQEFWGGKNVIFHSRDIRKCDKEFKILLDTDVKGSFYSKIDDTLSHLDYTIISSIIHKIRFTKKYGKITGDVYEIALSFIIERTIFYLDSLIDPVEQVNLIIEKRGKKEDRNLKKHIEKLIQLGTYYVSSERIKAYNIKYSFVEKSKNINGLQISDLIAYPIARYSIDKKRANPAFDIISPKIYSKCGKIYGLKEFP